MAKLYFRYSTMGAGKSLDLLKTAYNYDERDKNVILFTSSLDNRYGTKKITSRVGISREAFVYDETTNIFEFKRRDEEKVSMLNKEDLID